MLKKCTITLCPNAGDIRFGLCLEHTEAWDKSSERVRANKGADLAQAVMDFIRRTSAEQIVHSQAAKKSPR